MIELENLVRELVYAKDAEAAAKLRRNEIEKKICELINNETMEGTKRVATNMWSVSVSNSLKRTLDHEAYLSIMTDLPEGFRFVEYKPEINLKRLRHVEAVDPKIVAACVTVKPAKPSIEFREVV